jgi:hypothetical protein
VYRNFDIEHENEAPVVLTVDVAKGPIADAIKIHWQNAWAPGRASAVRAH